jgi:HEAT repeat protein
MASQTDVQDFLNDLLMTDREVLQFLCRMALPEAGGLPAPEQAVVELAAVIGDGRGVVPPGLMHWLRAPTTLGVRARVAVIRMAGLMGGEGLAEPLMTILRQLTFVAAHPAAVRALSEATGVSASAVLSKLLWELPPQQWHVREPAIIKELGRLRRRASIPDLVQALGVPYEAPVRAAAKALAGFPPDDVVETLIPMLAPDKAGGTDPRSAGAAEALGLLGDDRAIVALQRSAGSADPRVAINSAVALARFGAPDAEARLASLASHRSVAVRASAIEALGLVGTKDETSALRSQRLMQKALTDSQPEVRTAAARALGGLGRPAVAADIARALVPEVSPLVRAAMIRALGRLAHPLSVQTLVSVLETGDGTTKVEVLGALALFGDPEMAKVISPYRASSDPRVVEAASKALMSLLHKVFRWPEPAEVVRELRINLYSQESARERLLPPPPPPPQAGFFGRLFGAKAPEPPPPPKPIGVLTLTPDTIEIKMRPGADSSANGRVSWTRRFGLHVTRESVQEGVGATNDMGVHFALRQRRGSAGAEFDSVGVSLWCAPSPEVASLPAKSERFPCLDPHNAEPLLAALRWYAQVHGESIQGVRSSR